MSVNIQSDFSAFNEGINTIIKNLGSLEGKLDEIKKTFTGDVFKNIETSFKNLAPQADAVSGAFDKLAPKTKTLKDSMVTANTEIKKSTKSTVKAMSGLTDTIVANKAPVKDLAGTFIKLSDKLAGSGDNMTIISRKFANIAENSKKLNGTLKASRTAASAFAKTISNAFKNFDLDKKLKSFKNSLSSFIKEVNDTVRALGNLRRSSGLETFTNANKKIQTANQQLSSFNKNLRVTQNNGQLLAHMAIYKIFSRISIYVRQSITNLNDFDRALSEIFVVSGGDANLQKLGDDIIDLSRKFGIAKNEISEAVYQIISLRYADSGNAISKMQDLIKGAIALKTDLTSATELIAAAYNNYGEELGNTNILLAKFHRTIQLGKVRMSELKNIMGTILPVAQSLGVSLDEVNAMFATFTIKGTTAAKAGTQIRSLLISLLKPSESLAKAYEQLGYESGKQAIQLDGFSGVLRKLNDHFEGNSQALAKALSRQRSITAFTALAANGFKEYSEAVDAGRESIENFNKVKATPLQDQAKQFEIAVESLKRNFEESFTKPFRDGVIQLSQHMKPLIDAAFKLGKAFLLYGGAIYILIKIRKGLDGVVQGTRNMTKSLGANHRLITKLNIAEKKYAKTKEELRAKYFTAVRKSKAALQDLRNVENARNKASGRANNNAIIGFRSLSTAASKAGIKIQGAIARTRIAMSRLITSIKAAGIAFKSALISTGIGLAVVAVIAVIQELIVAFDSVAQASKKLRENAEKSFTELQSSVERSMEQLKNHTSDSIEKVRESFKKQLKEINADIREILDGRTFEDFSKDFEKSMKENGKNAEKAIENSLKAIQKLIKEATKNLEEFNGKLADIEDDFKDRLSSNSEKIEYEIELIINKKAFKELGNDLKDLKKDSIKLEEASRGKIRDLQIRATKKGADVGKIFRQIKDVKEKLEEDLAKNIEEQTAIKVQREISELFISKTIPPLFKGLGLKETEKKIRQVNELIREGKKEIVDDVKLSDQGLNALGRTSEAYDKTLKQIKDSISEIDALIAVARKAGQDTTALESLKQKLKAREKLYAQNGIIVAKKELEQAKETEAKILEVRSKFASSLEDKNLEGLKESINLAKETLKGRDLIEFKEAASKIILDIEKNNELVQLSKEQKVIQEKQLNQIALLRLNSEKSLILMQNQINKSELDRDTDKGKADFTENKSLKYAEQINRTDIDRNLSEAIKKKRFRGEDVAVAGDLQKALEGNSASLDILIESYKNATSRASIEYLLEYLRNYAKTSDAKSAASSLETLLKTDFNNRAKNALIANRKNEEINLKIQTEKDKAVKDQVDKEKKQDAAFTNVITNAKIDRALNKIFDDVDATEKEPKKVADEVVKSFDRGENAPTVASTVRDLKITLDDKREVNIDLVLNEEVLSRVMQRVSSDHTKLVFA